MLQYCIYTLEYIHNRDSRLSHEGTNDLKQGWDEWDYSASVNLITKKISPVK